MIYYYFSALPTNISSCECISLLDTLSGLCFNLRVSAPATTVCVIFYMLWGATKKMRSHLREILRPPPPARRLQFWHRLLKSIALFCQYFIHTHAKAPSAAVLATWESNFLLSLCLPLILQRDFKS